MDLFINSLHVVLSVLLILIILLQPAKGSDIGAAFGGGGSSTMFGPRGAGNLLSRATTVVAVMFMCTSISLAMRSTPKNASGTVVGDDILNEGLDEIDLGLDDFDFGIPDVDTVQNPTPLPPVPALEGEADEAGDVTEEATTEEEGEVPAEATEVAEEAPTEPSEATDESSNEEVE